MGMDGHDVGIKVIAQELRNSGFEVIYLGPYQTPEMVVKAAVQETVDVIAIGSHSGEYNFFIPSIMQILRNQQIDEDIKVILGGLISKEDIPKIKGLGVDRIFPIGTSLNEIIEYVGRT
jgi:methylmalonyl-CoA mutase C-terminal domain/subunit